ncbi:hypothetical protein M427DRAFT_55206 [Gonapodya prolifera JEL478]|uniref:Uncharacterized protein n=1 Tax=Gonapodya prolifera (strain JEL478) TaxID=1344416 RepID=A0A139AJF9_GONPJ|nr:hypothetical protein M427DRAFT_55206 [Gonapodya prolifera JEL478]|eukprot:KXS16879.1 hypothetical protein M427DRAFT_55206 [Gonapodya prolifera JEL478]
MIYDLMPLYPIYSWQLLIDVMTSSRFLFVLYSLRWRKRALNWITLIVDLCVLGTIIASIAEVVILLTELPQPLETINFQRILFSGSSNFIITGVLYCAMSAYSRLEKSPVVATSDAESGDASAVEFRRGSRPSASLGAPVSAARKASADGCKC